MPELPGHDRREERREGVSGHATRPGRRRVHNHDERERGEVELPEVERRPEPPVEISPRALGLDKAGDRPKGWPGPDARRDDPRPFDGSWDRPGEDS